MKTHLKLFKRLFATLLFSALITVGCSGSSGSHSSVSPSSPSADSIKGSLVSTNSSAAGSFEEVKDAYKRKDYTTAFKKLKFHAKKGHAEAQHLLGYMYQKGMGGAKDFSQEVNNEEAVRWYRAAAQQGHVMAQGALGFMYGSGRGVPKDYAEAAKWFRKAAEQGDAPSQMVLGSLYQNGNGVLQDYSEAVKWFRKAAEQGEPSSLYSLGISYANGRGVPQDNIEAHKWFNLAATRLPSSDTQKKARINRDTLEKKMTPTQVEEAQKLAREWKPKPHKSPSAPPGISSSGSFEDGVREIKAGNLQKAFEIIKPLAEQGDANAQGTLGVMYRDGKGVRRDDAEAVKWFRKAAEQGNITAQKGLGYMYDKGELFPQDDVKAAKWWRKAAEQGDANAQFVLGSYYSEGKGVTQDDTEAVKWWRKAAEQGRADAQMVLGLIYSEGKGVTQDDTEAVKWWRKAAEQGRADAQFFLGTMYGVGRGVPTNDVEAVKWYRKAAEQGDTKAQEMIDMYAQGRGVPHVAEAQRMNGDSKKNNGNVDGSTSEDITQTILSLARQMDNGSPEAKKKLREFRKLALNPSTEADSIFAIFQAFGKVVAEGWKQHPEIERSGDSMMTPGVTLFLKRIGDTEKSLDLLIKEAFLLQMAAQEILFRFYVEIASVSNKPQFWDRYQPKILNLFQEGAEDRIPRFRYYLSEAYYRGLGVAKDEERAISLLKDNTIEEALKLLANIYLKRGQRDLAVNVLQNAEKLGFAFGPYNLGVLSGGKGEYELAVQYWNKALELDPKYWEAKLSLAQAYGTGQGVNKTEAKAFKFMKEAVDEGNPDNKFIMAAQYQVGVYYLEGIVVEKSVNNAVKYFSLAAEKGNSEAQFKLGNIYTRGREVPRDFNKAFMWLRKAAEQNLAKAQYNLGILYINGQGVQQDYDEGIKWVRKAADQGFAPAKRALESISKKEQK
jgi:TPR repeat protein